MKPTTRVRVTVDLNNLTTAERLALLAEVWNSLDKSPRDLPLTRAQREDLDRRLDDLERGEVPGIPWDDVLDRIR